MQVVQLLAIYDPCQAAASSMSCSIIRHHSSHTISCALQAAALSREARMLLDVLVKQLGLAQILTLHPQAVGVRDNATVAVNTAGRSR